MNIKLLIKKILDGKIDNYSSKRPSLIINAFSNWSALAINIIVGLLLTPFIIVHLGKTGYGIWTLISSIIGYYGILDFGLSSAITRYVARYYGQKDYEAINKTVNTSLMIFIVVGFLTICISFIIATPLADFFNINLEHISDFKKLVWILGISMGLGFTTNLFGAVIRAHEHFAIANIANISFAIVRASLIVLFLSSGAGLIGVGTAHLISTSLVLILNFIFCKKIFPYLKINFWQANWGFVHILISFGALTTVIEIANIL
ncbi:MAG: MATE family efflux transporter [Candidatus Helarchaeota archaeon]